MCPVIAYSIQDVGPIIGHGGPSVTVLAVLVLGACGGALAVKLAEIYVPRVRRAFRARRRRRRRDRECATAEVRARALMSELCPQGWRAQITLFEANDELPPGAPDGDWARVALDWAELDHARGGPAVVRRVWARAIGEALDAMVADRRTDETLEQIEQGAAADGAEWPDL
jgi:hypothetical protein